MNIDKRLVKLLVDTKRPLVLMVVFGVLETISVIGQAAVLAKIIADTFLENKSLEAVESLLLIFALISLFRALFSFLGRGETVKISEIIRIKLYRQLITHITALGPTYVKKEQSGELVNTIFNGVNKLDAYFSQYIPQLFYSALIPLSILIIVFPADILSGVVLLLTAPIIPIFMNLIGSTAAKQTKKQWAVLSRMSAYFLDVLQGLSTLKIFGKSNPKIVGISEISNQFRKITMKVLRIAFLSALVLELAATLSVAIIAVEIGIRLLYDKISFETALFILILAPEFYQPLRQLGARFHAGMEGVSAAQRIFEIFQTKPLPASIKTTDSKVKKSDIVFENVSFSYAADEPLILKDISFCLHPGKVNFLVGESGAGKSTIAALLAGFIRPKSGEIYLNSIPLGQYGEENSRNQMAYLIQNPYMFHRSVHDNLIIANSKAKIDTIYHAMKTVQLHDFILSLPQGYQTIIGEQGERFSGGQIQRLALARVILRNAPIMILDEPTSNLDSSVERRIMKSIRKLAENKTVLLITHRLSVVQKDDRVIYLDNGKIRQN